METFAALAHGMAVAMQPMNLLYALIGVFLGTAVGVLPGIGPALTVALLLPVTYKLDPGGSLIMFAGIYYGGMYGGSTTAILINTPGESASPIANRPTASVVTSTPSSNSGTPNDNRACPVSLSMPIRPSVRPTNSEVRPRIGESPKVADTVMNATHIRAK